MVGSRLDSRGAIRRRPIARHYPATSARDGLQWGRRNRRRCKGERIEGGGGAISRAARCTLGTRGIGGLAIVTQAPARHRKAVGDDRVRVTGRIEVAVIGNSAIWSGNLRVACYVHAFNGSVR